MKGVTNKVSVGIALSIALLVVMSFIIADACFDPTDRGSIEVVLNKPGIEYNVSILNDLRDVVKLEGRYGIAYAYRSHYNTSILVIISLQPLTLRRDADKYLAIRVESPIKEEKVCEETCSLEINLDKVVTIDENKAKSLGWYCESSSSSGYGRGYLSKTIDSTDVRIYIITDKGMGTKIDITMTIGNKNEFTRAVAEVRILLNEAFKPSIDVEENQFICKERSYQTMQPVFSEYDMKQALMTELKWLRDIGVINGLSDEELSRIIEAAKIGYAGWNSRLIYYSNNWIPYADVVNLIEGAALLRSIGCSVYVDESMLPSKAPEYTTHLTTSPAPITTVARPYDTTAITISLAVACAAAIAAYLLITRHR